MKLSIAAIFAAFSLTCVQATKPAMHAGHLTLQDLLALRNGNMLPMGLESEYHRPEDNALDLSLRAIPISRALTRMFIVNDSNNLDANVTPSYSSAAPLATDSGKCIFPEYEADHSQIFDSTRGM